MLSELQVIRKISLTLLLDSDLRKQLSSLEKPLLIFFRRFTTEDEVDLAVEIIKDRVKVLRAMSPFLEDDSDDDDIKVDWVGVGGQVKY